MAQAERINETADMYIILVFGKEIISFDVETNL